MLVRKLHDTLGTPREVVATTWTSRRLLLRADGMGFSLHDTLMRPGTSTPMWYRHHLEAVYCIEGHGVIETQNAERFEIAPGTVYALDQHDKHTLHAVTELRLVCVFNPSLVGDETHDAEGAYPAASAL